jgi:hypothetical protein
MKKLLLLFTVLGSFVSVQAQGTCATATTITANGTFTTPAVNGSYQLACDQSNGELTTGTPAGIWYKFTAASNGTVAITSSLPQNNQNTQDSRLSVYTGTCGALTCLGGNDDISSSNYMSAFNFNALSGTTYYIQWDNRWAALAFDFSFTFTAVSCLPVLTVNAPTNIATNSITLNWATATGAPAEYQVQYGSLGFSIGSGTTVTVTTNSANLTSLTASTNYDYYIRSKCGAADFSAWTAVSSFTTAKILPYASNFDTNDSLVGWTIATNGPGGQGYNATGTAGHNSTPGYWIFGSSTTTANNNWIFSPAVSLQSGEQVTVSFYTRSSTSPRTLRVTAGTAATAVAQTTQLAALNVVAGTTWDLNTIPVFTAPSAGIYYFGFNDNSAPTATAVNMRLDSFNFTSNLKNNDFLASNMTVYPNPTKNIINISNSLNAVVDTVVMTDLNGRLVKTQKVNATEGQINISDLAAGIYMMNVTTDQGTATKKVIKE